MTTVRERPPAASRRRRKMRRSQYVDPDWVRTTEPRLTTIKRQIENLLQVVQLEKDGEVVDVDGFRIRDLNDWLVPIQNDINAIMAEVASPCDLSCDFCYLKGLPPGDSYGRMRPYDDIQTKIRHFSPENGTMMFQMLNQVEEHLRHPNLFEIMTELREISDKRFEIITNGSVLNEEFVARLAEFKPINISVSLNVAQPANRKKLMRDRNGQTAVDSLPLLRKYGIPFRVGIVPWPTISFEDIIETVRYADENEALIARIGFPGYTQYFPLRPEITFDRETYWAEIVENLLPLADELETPLVFIPYLFIENTTRPGRKNEAVITGRYRNSPAALAGIKPFDVIMEINGTTIVSRPHAMDILHSTPNEEAVEMVIRRDGSYFKVRIDPDVHEAAASYPYTTSPARGLLIPRSFRLGYLDNIRQFAEKHNAKSVLVMTSELMKPTVEQAIAEVPALPDDVTVHLEVPKHRFWGGNIVVSDLLVVDDFIAQTRDFIDRTGTRPDLILVPGSGFNQNRAGNWHRDMIGTYYKRIEHITGIPVELIETETIFY